MTDKRKDEVFIESVVNKYNVYKNSSKLTPQQLYMLNRIGGTIGAHVQRYQFFMYACS